MYNLTKSIIEESISLGADELSEISRYKLIPLAAAYLEERDNEDRDPSLNLNKLNNRLLSNILSANTDERINQLQQELAHSIIDENEEELSDIFEDSLNEYLTEEKHRGGFDE